MSRHLREYRRGVELHSVLRHPFVRAFRAGELSKAQVLYWLVQQYFISVALPQCFAAIYARVPTHLAPQIHRLAQVVGSEAWGAENSGGASNGARLCLLASLGFNMNLRKSPPALVEMQPYTAVFIDLRLRICSPRRRKLYEAVAALALGNELFNQLVMDAYGQGIVRVDGLKECPLGYFTEHAKDETDKFILLDKLYWLVCPDHDAEPREYLRLLRAREVWMHGLWADIQKIRG